FCIYTIHKARQAKMSENAERPARSRPRIGADGAADLILYAAFSEKRTGLLKLANLSYFWLARPPRDGVAAIYPSTKTDIYPSPQASFTQALNASFTQETSLMSCI
ncbi:MAG: hypothetical protein J6X19_01370, partial [Clostridia bacterium]|nr:hypothetical protein [Clostridia bacterium]